MLQSIKEAIRKKLYNRCYRGYRQETDRQSRRYAAFLKQQGESPVLDQAALTEARGMQTPAQEQSDPTMMVLRGANCLVFAASDGILEERAVKAFSAWFRKHPACCASYAQEDCVDEKGGRHHPWFKPVFSPDTLADSFYAGNIFAVRDSFCPSEPAAAQTEKAVRQKQTERAGQQKQTAGTGRDGLPARLDQYTARSIFLCAVRDGLEQAGGTLPPAGKTGNGAGLLDEILFHRFAAESQQAEGRTEALPPDNPFSVWLQERQEKEEGFALEVYRMGIHTALSGRKLVSVIIPSRDNPAVLQTCLTSLREKTEGIGYEIIVVDNGSTPENRALLEKMAGEQEFLYLYEPREFNFSVMCNLGAARASCAYLLFLNDDMEILQKDWMLRLYEKACMPHAGAVGAKLLYPASDLIQHAGVTNLQAGPAHKLLKEHDSGIYYHGKNRGVHDMLAVTAACLMVSREKFSRAGGFDEEIAVSYNDVDLCFTLYERGWYNIQRNDVTLYHHESLSRGDDNLSDEKWERLLLEKERLYKKHPALKGYDPFYSEHLAGYFSDYLCRFEYDYERRDRYTGISALRGPEPLQWSNNCLTVNVEHARRERRLELTEEKEVYWIEGWSYVLGMDNCRYSRELLLLGSNGRNWRAKLLTRYRPDVQKILQQQSQVALSGFTCRIPRENLPAGEYRIAMLARDRCSGQKLYQTTDTFLVVEK